jgi:hypothetical protein
MNGGAVLRMLCVVFSGARGEALDERDVDGSDCAASARYRNHPREALLCLDRRGVCMRQDFNLI